MGNLKTSFKYLLIVLISSFIYDCTDEKNPSSINEADNEIKTSHQKEWTFLMYDDADFRGAFDPVYDLSERMYSGKDLDILVLQDTDAGPAKLWYIDENHQMKLLKEMGEINMGSEQTLYDFIDYGKDKYPAQRYILALYDHGGGWLGACWDRNSGYDFLSMDEMQQALNDVGGVDMIWFTAPCLMAAVESVYELRDCTEIYIGSENISGYCWWMYPMTDICKTLHENPTISNSQLSKLVIKLIWQQKDNWGDYDWVQGITMSAVNVKKINRLVDELNKMSETYFVNSHKFHAHLDSIYHDIEIYYSECVDIYSLTKNLLAVEKDVELRKILADIQRYLISAVIAECHGTEWTDASGLSIYMAHPDNYYYSSYCNSKIGLDFTRDTYWDELITSYFSHKQAMGKDIIKELPRIHDGFQVY